MFDEWCLHSAYMEYIQVKLNKSSIDKLQPPSSGYSLFWDDAMPGFGLRITTAGVRSFIVQKRIDGKEHRATLGRYGVLTPEQARREAQKFLGQVAQGVDPIAEKVKARAESATIEESLQAYFKARPLKPRTIRDTKQAFKGFEDWEKKPLSSITREMISKRHRELGEHSQARANLAMRYLRALFNFAIAHYTDKEGQPYITDNPVNRLSQTRSWYRVEQRETVINPHQLKPWFKAVLSLSNEVARDYFLTIMLTGLRRTEAMDLNWVDVNLKGKTLTVRDTKNHRDHTLPLSDYLFNILKERKALAEGEYVFQSSKGRMQNLRYAQKAVIKDSEVSFTIHDLRRTFATIANSLDIPAYTVKMLLNHKMSGDVTAGYIIADVERLREPMKKITAYILKQAGI
jgi:integrase